VLARWARTRPPAVAAAVLIVLAVYSKQQALLVAPALFAFLLLARRGSGLAPAFAATAGVGLVVPFVVADAISDGWFSFYVIELGGQHPYAEQYIHKFFTEDLGIVGLALIVCAAAVWRWRAEGDRERLLFYVGLGLALGVGSFLSRIHEGGYPNVVLPTYLFLAVLTGIAFGRETRPRWALGAGVLLILQFLVLAYDPGKYIPSGAEGRRSEQAVEAIRALPGDVYVTSYPLHARRAGKPEYVHTAALLDIARADPSETRRRFQERFDAALEAHCFSHVVGSGFETPHYRRARALTSGTPFEALSGLPVPIGDVYVPTGPRRASPGPTGRATRCRTGRPPAPAPGGG